MKTTELLNLLKLKDINVTSEITHLDTAISIREILDNDVNIFDDFKNYENIEKRLTVLGTLDGKLHLMPYAETHIHTHDGDSVMREFNQKQFLSIFGDIAKKGIVSIAKILYTYKGTKRSDQINECEIYIYNSIRFDY